MTVNLIRRGVLRASPLQGIYVAVPLGVPLFIVTALVTGQLARFAELGADAFWLLVALGIIEYLIGRYSNFQAIQALGANASEPFRCLSVVVAILLANLVLHETVTSIQAFGIILVTIAPIIMLDRSKNKPVPDAASPISEPSFTVRQAKGYLFGMVTALAFGSTPLLIRTAIGGTGLGMIGGVISYAGATSILLVLLLHPRILNALKTIPRASLRWFGLTSITSFLAHMFRFVALDIAPVSIVAPLAQTSAVFTVLFAYIFNRLSRTQSEIFRPRVLFAILLSMIGSIALVVQL